MKKVNTVVAKQGRNFSQQKLTIGLDLGDRSSWYCVLDEAGQIQLEHRVATTAKGLREVFEAMPRSRVALETGNRLRRRSQQAARYFSGITGRFLCA
jgi:predicted NBD/HSP70 family sugar kinase